MKSWFKQYWWVPTLIVLIIAAIWVFRHEARKKAEAAAKEERRLDSLTIRAYYLDSVIANHQAQIGGLEANAAMVNDAISKISEGRKNEYHAYTKNVAAVRAMPTDQQVSALAGWLPKVDTSVR